MKWKWRGRKWSRYNLRYYQGIFVEELRKIRKSSVRIVCAPPEIRVGHLANTKQEYYALDCSAQ
jgi:hypothetical protein